VSGGGRRSGADEATRALAQAEFCRPLVIEAGAGTGKTALLVARVAAWCVGPGWVRHAEADRPGEVAQRVIDGVVAITFTEAAAAEMATRIGEALSGLARGEAPVGWCPVNEPEPIGEDELRARAAALGNEAHRLRVTTIHAFCQRLLTAHPFAAHVHPRFEIDADGTLVEALADEVVLEALRELDRSPLRGDWERLAAEGEGPARVAEALRALVAAGAVPADLERDPFDEERARATAGDLQAVLRSVLDMEGGRFGAVKRATRTQATIEVLDGMLQRLEEAGTDVSFGDIADAISGFDSGSRKKLRAWAKGTFGKGEATCLGEDLEGFAHLAGAAVSQLDGLRGLDPEAFGAARSVLLALLEEVEGRRTARGIASFADLLTKTARLLEEHEELCRGERRRMDQLLVDEFQDTDDIQCRIVRRLALDGPDDERPGLFVVGDPKQSIYAWRSADLKAYDEFVDMVVSRGGEKRPLTRNFRSVRPILDEVERVVEPVMHREKGFQPEFQALEATGDRASSFGFDTPPWSAVEHWICWHLNDDGVIDPAKQRSGDTTVLEAAAIAADVRRLHDSAGVAFGDIAVLLRATTAQNEILEAFRKLDVPFEVSREREYFRQREIVEAAALVRAVLEPADTLALLAVLRSDPVGVPDAALAPLWDAGLPAAAAALDGRDGGAMVRAREVVDRAAAATGDVLGLERLPCWSEAVSGVLEVLAELRRSLREDPPDVFVERLRTLWLAEVSAGARFLGRFRQARLDGFYSDLEEALCRGAGGVAELARFLRRAVAEGREAPRESEPDRAADAVHVMTIYGAKGLDFGHVYLAQIHRSTGGRRGRDAAVFRRAEGSDEMQLFGWPSPGFGSVEQGRADQECAERVRLLYVAMTRAKQRLVVSGGWATPGVPVDPLEVSTVAELVAHRGDPELIGGLIERGEARGADPEPGVVWYVPGVVDDGASQVRATTGSAAATVDIDAAAADAAALARARRASSDRMMARWSSPASDAAHRARARMEAEPEEKGNARAPTVAGAGAAAAVGTAVHRLLEIIDLSRDLASEVADRRSAVIREAAVELAPVEAAAAVSRFETLVDGLPGSGCMARLAEVSQRVMARELEVFLGPRMDDGTSVISGAVDLVYSDPDDGRLVVADYKTDAVESDAELAGRVERYRPQLATYARALEHALSLDEAPHTELWFLGADRIVRVD
jgi:ATP-dependent helicase/nuclease subunit A